MTSSGRWTMAGRASRPEAYTLLTCCLKAPLAAAVRDRSDPDPAVRARSDRYAASTRIVCEVIAQRAKRMTKPAPLVYMNLTGRIRPGDG